ncbi:MFS domain-containing protein [Caerostris extrusa]|uniref:MFS domain-containing protein n=1 Tax=Caerostris extrusa TaxID=172846 RepID=A0AAV4T0J6_CAEEX|nr:MFS domain-containing protein [Caerostris extrusa]
MNRPDIQTLRHQSETVVAILQSVPPDLEQIKHELGPDLSGLSHGSHIWFGLEILCQSTTGLKPTTGKIVLRELLCKPYLESSHKFEINSVSQEYSKELILLKLKKFQDIDVPDILSLCSNENKNSVLNISMELKRLFKTFSQLERSQNGIIPMTTVQQTTVPVKNFSRKMSFRENFKNTFKLFWTYSKIACKDFIMDKGLSQYDGQYAVIALSTGDLLGRLALGWVTDYGFLSLPRFMLLTMVLQSISTVTLPLMNTKVLIYVALGVFGMFQGTLFVRHSVLVSKYMENHEQSVGMGCFFGFFSGMFGLGLSRRFFKDQVGNYDFMLYISGSIGALVGLLWILNHTLYQKTLKMKKMNRCKWRT